jgi:hypothetical protein
MTKLRDDVRGAFDREQSALGDVGDARHRLIHNALAASDVPASRGLQWAAAVAAVLIAAIVIVTFALARANSHSNVLPAATPSPKAAVSPTPLTKALNVADSTPIIVYGDPANRNQLDGVTWDGKTAGKLTSQQLVGGGNPQNNLFAGSNSIDDRAGNTVMTGSMGIKGFQGTWADDGRHICLVTPFNDPGNAGVPTTLQLVTVGPSPQARNVARVGTLNQQTFVRAVACSTRSDRAVVVQSGGQGVFTAQYWVVQLSTGKVIWTHSFDVAHTSVDVITSRDGVYVAENLTQAAPTGSTVYGPDGKAVAHLPTFIEAFSWNGDLAVVDMGYGSTQVNLISWRDGAVLWTCPPGVGLLRAVPEPDGTKIAVWLVPAADFQQLAQTPDLYVLTASGAVVFHIARSAMALP